MDYAIPNKITNSPIEQGVYRHYSGKYYQVLGTARHSEDLEEYVMYKALYGDHVIWIRPLGMFKEMVSLPSGERALRFTYIGSEIPSLH